MSKVEFSFLVEQGPLDVLLKDVCFVRTIVMLFFAFKDCLNLIKVEAHNNSRSSVGILPRFDDPGIEFVDWIEAVFILSRNGIEMLQKDKVLVILKPIFDVEGERQKIEDFLANIRIILWHCLE